MSEILLHWGFYLIGLISFIGVNFYLYVAFKNEKYRNKNEEPIIEFCVGTIFYFGIVACLNYPFIKLVFLCAFVFLSLTLARILTYFFLNK